MDSHNPCSYGAEHGGGCDRKDPHYVLLLQNDHIRVFALTLPPGAQSFVQHEHNYLTIQVEEHEVIMWKDGESPIQHFRLPAGEIHFFLGG